MYLKALLVILAVPLMLSLATESDSDSSCFKRYYRITGKLESTYFSQGGTYRSYEPLIPAALANYTLVVVKIDDSTRVPEVVDQITSDAFGNFSIKLPPGKYGFVSLDEMDQLDSGQCMPKNIFTGDEFSNHSSTWVSNMPCPVDLTSGSVDSLVLTNHQTNICGLCP